MLRFLTAGESHGPAEVAILEGMVAGLLVTKEDLQKELDRRRTDSGRGGRSAVETDEVEILSGIRHGKTLGSPIALMVKNKDFENWKDAMSSQPTTHNLQPITTPRPGHADFAGAVKYAHRDIRNVLERASARETVMRVAIGAICKKFLQEFTISVSSRTVQIGTEKSGNFENIIMEARKQGDTLGGVIEVIAHNMPIGLGSHIHWDRKLDGRIAQVLMSIPSVKAVEIGEGIANASKWGSKVHDVLQVKNGGIARTTNRAGGIEGGISNGSDIVGRVYLKPLSTLMKPLPTVDITTKQETKALVERSDVCVVQRAGVIVESMLSYILADEMLIKFGGDNIEETKRNFEAFQKYSIIE